MSQLSSTSTDTPKRFRSRLSLPELVTVELFIALFILSVLPTVQVQGAVATVIPVALVLVLFCLLTLRDPDLTIDQDFRLWLIALFAFRLLFAFAYHQFHPHWSHGIELFRAGLTGYDAFRYDYWAANLAQRGLSLSYARSLPGDYGGVVLWYGLIYFIFGHHPLFAVLFNTLLGGLTSLLTYKLSLSLLSRREARWAAVGVMVWPHLVFYAALLMKEALIAFLFVLALYSWLRLRQDSKSNKLVLGAGLAASLYGLLENRIPMVAIVLVVMLSEGLLTGRRRQSVLLAIAASIVLVFLASYVAVSPIVLSRFGGILDPRFVVDYMEEYAQRPLEKSATDPASSLGIATSVGLSPSRAYLIPVRMAFFYLNPPPWQWGLQPTADPFRIPSAFLIYLSLPAVVYGLVCLIRQRKGHWIWIAFIFGTFVIGVPTPFLDDRLRVPLMPLYVMLAMVGFKDFERWKSIYVLYPFAGVAGALGYYAVKLYLGGGL